MFPMLGRGIPICDRGCFYQAIEHLFIVHEDHQMPGAASIHARIERERRVIHLDGQNDATTLRGFHLAARLRVCRHPDRYRHGYRRVRRPLLQIRPHSSFQSGFHHLVKSERVNISGSRSSAVLGGMISLVSLEPGAVIEENLLSDYLRPLSQFRDTLVYRRRQLEGPPLWRRESDRSMPSRHQWAMRTSPA